MTQQPDDAAILRRALSEAYVQIDGLRGMLAQRDATIAELQSGGGADETKTGD